MVNTKFFIGAAALSAPLVAGHGYMGLPKVDFPSGGDITAPVTTISASQFTAPSGMSFTTDPTSNTKAFTAWIKTSEYKSLRDLILKKSTAGACGNSKVGAAQPLPAAVEWTHGASEGFTPSHEGPCEVWCDDEMAFHDDNCAKNFPSAPAKLPYDKSKCEGKKQLATYWLALHSPDWQVYIGCAAIESRSGGGGGGSGGSAASPTPSSATPTVKPSTPSSPAATPAPAAGGNDDDCDEDLPEPDCDDEYPEPSDDAAAGEADDDCADDLPEPDCDDDLPEPECDDDLPEPDCDEEYPEPGDKRSYEQDDEVSTSNIGFGTINNAGGEADIPKSNIGFGEIDKKGGESAPGKVSPKQYT